MAEQAGIESIVLYEAKGINISYNSEGNIENIFTSGQEISINYCDQIKFTYSLARDFNNKIGYVYNLEYFIYDLTNANINNIINIKKSIYGFMPELYFYNGNRSFVNNPLFYVKNETPNNSNHFKINLQNLTPTKQKFITVDPIVGEGIGYWIIEDTFIVQ